MGSPVGTVFFRTFAVSDCVRRSQENPSFDCSLRIGFLRDSVPEVELMDEVFYEFCISLVSCCRLFVDFLC